MVWTDMRNLNRKTLQLLEVGNTKAQLAILDKNAFPSD